MKHVPITRSLGPTLLVLLAAVSCTPSPAPSALPSPRPGPELQEEPASSPEEQTKRSQTLPVEPALSPRKESEVAAPRVEFDGTGLGTKIRIVAYGSKGLGKEAVQDAFERALAEMRRLEALLSGWRDDSDVGRINQAPGQFVQVSPETLEVVEHGLHSGRLSGGAFDITFQSLGHLWRFGDAREAEPRVPEPRDVQAHLEQVDYTQVTLDRETGRIKIGAGQQMGLGGVAKGYIVDQMARVLREGGLDSFLVQAGGDLYAEGRKPDGRPWEAGVQDPRREAGHSFAKLLLEDRAFSTAGDYARSYFVEGRRYHHIIDPKTGYPATASRSVTVWAKTAVEADALDDAVFILGPEKGLALVESLEGVGAVIVDSDNRLWVSQRLRQQIRLSHLPTPGP